jgi:hypothetical protein
MPTSSTDPRRKAEKIPRGIAQQAAGGDGQAGKDQRELQVLQHQREQWLLEAE